MLDIICCPDCYGSVMESKEILTCMCCGKKLPIIDGIYSLLPSQALKDTRAENNSDYKKWIIISSDSLSNYFENGSKLYYLIHHSAHKLIHNYCRQNLKGGLFLDLGCGTGAHYPYYQETISNVIGLDINIKSLQQIKKRFPKAFLIQGDCYKLPIKSSAIQGVISIYNLEHLFFCRKPCPRFCGFWLKEESFM